MLGALRAAPVDASNEAQAAALVRYSWHRLSLASFDIGLRFRSLNFLDSVVRTSRRARIQLGGEPETDTFGQEPALVARTCSPAKLLGFLKFVGALRCNDARRCHPCPWHSQDALAAMAWCRTSEQPRRVAICTDRQQRNAGKRGTCGTADRWARGLPKHRLNAGHDARHGTLAGLSTRDDGRVDSWPDRTGRTTARN